MRRAHLQRRLARSVRSSRGEGRTREVRPERCTTPSSMRDARAAAAPFAMTLSWTALFSYRIVRGKHINLLELESLISLLRRIRREGTRTRRILVLVDSGVVLGVVSKGRSSSRKVNFMFRKLGFWCLAFVIANGCGCRPGRTQLMPRLGTIRSGVGMRRYRGFLRFLLPPLRRLRHARSWTCSVSRCRLRPLQHPSKWCFQQFGTLTCLRRERPSTSLREYFLDFKRDASTSCKCQKQLEGREILPIRHVGLTTSRSSLFRVGSMRLPGSPCQWDRDQTTGGTNCCIVQVTSKNTLGQNVHFLCVHKTSQCRWVSHTARVGLGSGKIVSKVSAASDSQRVICGAAVQHSCDFRG